MLSSSCCIRALSLRSVKFLSRLLTALNLLPSMATIASEKSFRLRHKTMNSRHTLRIALPLSLRKICDGLEIRHQPTCEPDQLDITLRLAFQTPAGLNQVQVALDV